MIAPLGRTLARTTGAAALLACVCTPESAFAAPFSFDRVDVLSEDPGTWMNYEIPTVSGGTASTSAIRFLFQVKPVWRTPVENLTIGTSIASQSVVYEHPVSRTPWLALSAGVQTRLLMPAGLTVGAAWRGGPVRVGLGVSLLSSATWVRPNWSDWAVLPTLGVGFGRKPPPQPAVEAL